MNLKKTEVIHFTRKRKTSEVVKLDYQGVKLSLTKEVKYLNIALDEKLMWKTHIENQAKKGMKTLWSGYAFISRTGDLIPSMTL